MTITTSVDVTPINRKNTSSPIINITPVTGDSLLVVTVYIDDTGEGDFSSISDDQGNTYVNAADMTISGGGQRMLVYYVHSPVVAATEITVVTTASLDSNLGANTYQGTETSSALDHATTSDTDSTSPFDLTFSTNVNNSLIVYMMGYSNNGTLTSYGTGQVSRGEVLAGGAEKMALYTSSEITTTSGSNNQQVTVSKNASAAQIACEFLEEVVGFAHSQGYVIG